MRQKWKRLNRKNRDKDKLFSLAFSFAQHENKLALLNNFVLSCQERWAAEVKLSATQERIKQQRFEACIPNDNLSLSGFGGGLPALGAHLLAAALPSAARCWSVACDRRSLVVLSPLLVHIYSHTLTSHTCMLKWKHSHVDVHTHAHPLSLPSTHEYTHTHTSSLPTCRCAPLRFCHALQSSLLAGPCVHVMTAVTWSMSAFKLKLTSRSDTALKSQPWPVC